MRITLTSKVREVLRQHPDGLSSREIAPLVGDLPNHVSVIAKRMPDVRIVRWVRDGGVGRPKRIWAISEGENAPAPTKVDYRSQRTPVVQQIEEVLRQYPTGMTCYDITETIDGKRETVKRALWDMRRKGIVYARGYAPTYGRGGRPLLYVLTRRPS